MLTRESIGNNNHIYVLSDKGNKKGNKNLAKFMYWYDPKSRKVKTFLLDVDCTDKDTADITRAIVHSLKRSFSDDVDIKLTGQCSDSGGGGIKYGFARVFKAEGLTKEY